MVLFSSTIMKAALLCPLCATIVTHGSVVAAQTARRPCFLATHYKIIAVPLHPARIDESGVVAGTTEDHQAATWDRKNGVRELTLPPGFAGAQALGINQAGDVVGEAVRRGSGPSAGQEKTEAFEYSRGKFILLSEAQSRAKAINRAREIAGESIPEGAVVWNTHGLRRLGGCCGGRALDLNNHGMVVGEVNDQQGRYSAFLWDSVRGMLVIGPAGAGASTALAINDAGDVLVQSFSPAGVFLRQHGELSPVELSTEFASQPLALNNCDVVVGQYGAASDFNHAFVWDRKNGFRDLNTMVNAKGEWTLESATDINDSGEIVGIGDSGNSEDAGFLLVPDQPAKTAKSPK
jgi:uncharacterized membrane protein